MGGSGKLTASARQRRIREVLKQQSQVSIGSLAELFGVSEMTIRRDLDRLEVAGQVRRTHGGAERAERMVFEFDFSSRRRARQREKQAIAAAAAALVEPGQRIILDTGTTTLELAILLRDCRDITVITPSLAVASVLQFSTGIETILLGGVLRRGSPDLTGPLTESSLEAFAVDVAFQGADGIGLDGSLYNEDMRITQVDKKMRQRATETYVLADSSKVGKTALATLGRVDEVTALITDAGIEEQVRRRFEEMGAKVIIAGEAR